MPVREKEKRNEKKKPKLSFIVSGGYDRIGHAGRLWK